MAMSPETKKAVVGSLVVLAIIGAVVLVVYFVSAKTSHKGKASAALPAAAPRMAGGSAIERDSMAIRAKMNALVARSAGARKAGAQGYKSSQPAFVSLGAHRKPSNDKAGGLGVLIEKVDCKVTEEVKPVHRGSQLLIDKGNSAVQRVESELRKFL